MKNPSRGKFSIQFNEVKKAPFNIIVFDIIGNKRFQKDIKLHNLENSFQLDLSFLDKGNYFFTIVEGQHKYTYQFIILE